MVKNKKLCAPPHILLKENIGQRNLLVQYSNKYLVYRDKIIGIHAPKKEKDQLVELYNYLVANNDLLVLLQCGLSDHLFTRYFGKIKINV